MTPNPSIGRTGKEFKYLTARVAFRNEAGADVGAITEVAIAAFKGGIYAMTVATGTGKKVEVCIA